MGVRAAPLARAIAVAIARMAGDDPLSLFAIARAASLSVKAVTYSSPGRSTPWTIAVTTWRIQPSPGEIDQLPSIDPFWVSHLLFWAPLTSPKCWYH